eukprot:310712_1
MDGIVNVDLDSWAIGEQLNIVTLTIQSICLSITLILVSIRARYIYRALQQVTSNWKIPLLPLIQFAMMLFSCQYLFGHWWNYVHSHLPHNSMDCYGWFALIMIGLTMTRVLLFGFLMLRSSLTFHGTFCALSYKISIVMVVAVALLNLVPLPFIIVGATPTHPIPQRGFCWGRVSESAAVASWVFHLSNGIASTAAVFIFYWKARHVEGLVKSLTSENKMSDDLMEIHAEFKKHIILGILTAVGTIFMFFIMEVLTVTLGIAFALDQTMNNVLTVVMFKEHAPIYQYLCCKCGAKKHKQNTIHLSRTEPSQGTVQSMPSQATIQS